MTAQTLDRQAVLDSWTRILRRESVDLDLTTLDGRYALRARMVIAATGRPCTVLRDVAAQLGATTIGPGTVGAAHAIADAWAATHPGTPRQEVTVSDDSAPYRFDVPDRVEWDHPQGHGTFSGVVVGTVTGPTTRAVIGYQVLVLDGPGGDRGRWVHVGESSLRPFGARVAYNRITDQLGRAADVAQELGRSSIELRLRELLDALADEGETPDVQDIVRALAPAERGDR